MTIIYKASTNFFAIGIYRNDRLAFHAYGLTFCARSVIHSIRLGNTLLLSCPSPSIRSDLFTPLRGVK